MYKIIGKDLGISVPGIMPSFDAQKISVIIPHYGWQPEYLEACMNATKIELYIEDGSEEPSSIYNLVNWMSCEKLWDGYKMTWQTIARDRLDEMQFKLDEMGVKLEESEKALAASQERVRTLTKAIIDLAADYGAIPPVMGTAASGAADDEVTWQDGTVSVKNDGTAENTATRGRRRKTAAEEVKNDG